MINFTISAEPLPEDFSGTPQQLLEAIIDRLTITSDLETFVEGSEAPTTNQGPWFKNGVELYGWNGTMYVPTITSDEVIPQIQAGETAPDHLKYSYWLRTSGNVVLGLFYYMGSEVGWVSQVYGVANGSITTQKLANGGISTEKIADETVENDNIFGPISVSKWPRGTARQILRTNAAGTSTGWEGPYAVSGVLPISLVAAVEFVHGQGEIPQFVRAEFVNMATEGGWAEGDTVPSSIANTISSHVTLGDISRGVNIIKGPTRVALRLKTQLLLPQKSDLKTNFVATPAKWGVRFYCTKR